LAHPSELVDYGPVVSALRRFGRWLVESPHSASQRERYPWILRALVTVIVVMARIVLVLFSIGLVVRAVGALVGA
jgi:hypothetical protein